MEPLFQTNSIGQLGVSFKAPVIGSVQDLKVFDQVLAARSQELAQQAKLAQASSVSATTQAEEPSPVDSVRREVTKSSGQAAEEVILPPEKKSELSNFLIGLGLSQTQTEEAIAQATRADGRINLGQVLKATQAARRKSKEGNLFLPAGMASEVLVLLQKMGLKGTDLDKLAAELGQDQVSLKRLAAIISGLQSPNLTLPAAEIAALKNILAKAGLNAQTIERLVGRYADQQGGVSLASLTALLQDASTQADPAVILAKSGRLSEAVAKLLEGAELVAGQSSQNAVAKTQEDLLKELTAAGKLTKLTPAASAALAKATQGQGEKSGGELSQQLKEALASILTKNQESSPQVGSTTRLGQVAQVQGLADESQGVLVAQSPADQDVDLAIFVDAQAFPPDHPFVQISGSTGNDQVTLTQLASLDSTRPESSLAGQKTTTAKFQPSVLLEQLVGQMKVLLKSGQSAVRLQLYPQELGSLRIDLKVEGQSVTATVVAENEQVQQILGSNMANLKNSLAEQGFNLARFEVLTQNQQQARSDQGQDQGRSKSGQTNKITPVESDPAEALLVTPWTLSRGLVDLRA